MIASAAKNVLRLLKIVLNFAVEDEIIEANPAARMKELAGGEYRSWTDDECAVFEKRWPSGMMQRRADQVAMTRACRTGGFIRVRQRKTGEDLLIPEHRALTAELATGEQGHISC